MAVTEDTLEGILAEADEVWSFSKEIRPQERAHAYLVKHLVNRGYSDTAMQCAAADMIQRAYGLGVEDGRQQAADSGAGGSSGEFATEVLRRLAEGLLEVLPDE